VKGTLKGLLAAPKMVVFANDTDSMIPEIWANESLMILQNNMIMGNLVHRDFEDEVANFGDVVNTRRPNDFTGQRKTDSDDITVQDAQAPNIPVPLDQHFHTSFLIRDGEESKSFKDLVQIFLEPAVISLAQSVDQVLTAQAYNFLPNVAGGLGAGGSKSGVISARKTMTNNKAPLQGRNLVIGACTEADLLNIDEFVTADKVGDEGTALREGSLGRKYGFNIFVDQNVPEIEAGNTIVTGAVNFGAGYDKGTTTITVDGFSAALTDGSWFTVEGDNVPQQIVSTVGGATPTSITFLPGLVSGVTDDAVVTVYTPGAVNNGAGYASGYNKELTIDGFTVSPQTGQLISLGAAGGSTYGSIDSLNGPSTTAVALNRSLEASVADNDVVGVGPAGNYNFFFHRNALALVSRPLAMPRMNTGAMAAIANFNNLGLRVVMAYDPYKQGTLVTVDLLCGTKVLDQRLGGVLLA
jgi:hypothetical protein